MSYLKTASAFLIALASSASAKPCPNLLFVLDQSSSMSEDPNGGMGKPSKFDLLRDAVIGVVNQYGDRVAMGMELFQSDTFMNDAKCYSDTAIQVEPAHDSAADLIAKLKAAQPVDGAKTNTGEAIKRAAADPILSDMERANYLILITDGDPSCNSLDLMTLSTTGQSDYTIGEINAAANHNPPIKTFVIGFDGSGVNKSNLSAMANAGRLPVKGCGNMTPCYYSASDAKAFSDAIAQVIDTLLNDTEFPLGQCDDSCYTNGCPPGQVCVRGELDPVAKCVPDPCQGATCSGGQFCRDGKCVNACTGGCKKGLRCVDGQCVTDACWGVNCPTGETCAPGAGTCVPDLCGGRQCAMYNTCDPVTGKCVDDLCHIITCPMGTTCSHGNCTGPTPEGKGCACQLGARPSSPSRWALLPLALWALRRRYWRIPPRKRILVP